MMLSIVVTIDELKEDKPDSSTSYASRSPLPAVTVMAAAAAGFTSHNDITACTASCMPSPALTAVLLMVDATISPSDTGACHAVAICSTSEWTAAPIATFSSGIPIPWLTLHCCCRWTQGAAGDLQSAHALITVPSQTACDATAAENEV